MNHKPTRLLKLLSIFFVLILPATSLQAQGPHPIYLPLVGNNANGSDSQAECELDPFLLQHAHIKKCTGDNTADPKLLDVINNISQINAVGVDPWKRPRENFVNWENPHVYPLDITPDGNTLLAVNTADNSLLVFDIRNGTLTQTVSIPVGLDPVSVRARSNTEAWVVNHVSDSVSVVDLTKRQVVATLQTDDEPADVIFGGTPQRAFVSASQANRVNVFDPANLRTAPQRIVIDGEDPRALAVSADGKKVYVAIFESGNGTTAVTGGKANGFEADLVRRPEGPYGGVNVPPNKGTTYSPAINPNNPAPPPVSMIVRKDASGRWMDDNNGDWSRFISGDLSMLGGATGGRVRGWDLPDRDVAVIDTTTLNVTYQNRLMNTLMALAVHPTTGEVTVVGTDATNQIRWEPNLQSTFLRVNFARFTPGGANTILDLNPHLNYAVRSIPQAQRNVSIGDPRGIAWNEAGTRAYVTGMGSNNVIVMDNNGGRVAQVNVGEGPTGIALQKGTNRAFVLNKFSGSISMIDLSNNTEVNRLVFYDPTPQAIKAGRKQLYDTHATSGLGQISCASCHIDARTDRLAWDLGNPAGSMTALRGISDETGQPITVQQHPMKGPLLTQTMQDIIGHPSMHWSGDKANLGGFAAAFVNLQGADAALTNPQVSEFEQMLDSVHIPPDPYRNLNNSFNTNVSIPGPHGTVARVGNAELGRQEFENNCRACHAGNSLRGDLIRNGGAFGLQLIRRGPSWRNFYERFGLWFDDATASNSGFGFQQDGTFDSTHNESRSANLMAFMLSVNGRFPYAPAGQTEGNQSKDTHAAVGKQLVLTGTVSGADAQTLNQFLGMSDAGAVGLVIKGMVGTEARGYAYIGSGQFQSDRANEILTTQALQALASTSNPLVVTVVPAGSETRIGIDHDVDGAFDRDELDRGSNPSNASSVPGAPQCAAPTNVASRGTATQSSTWGGNQFPAGLAIDGNPNNFSHTDTADAAATWRLALDGNYFVQSIVLRNRAGLGSRLRDITVYVLDDQDQPLFKSQYLNRNNRDNAPASISVDLLALTGAPVRGSRIRVVRTPDPLLLATNNVGNADESNVLSLAEVEVLGCVATTAVVPTPTNLAAGKPVAQSSTGFGGVPGRAVDGNTDGIYNNNSTTHTNGDANAWWQVDLGASRTITNVVLWNRTDCCADRLSNFYVFVSATDLTGRTFNTIVSDSSVWRVQTTGQAPTSLNLPVGTTGRYVRVQLAGTNNLSLAEVQVFGSVVSSISTNVAQGKTTSASSSIDINGSWGIKYATDGLASAVNPLGWSSNNNLATSHTEWLRVDLGAVSTVNQVVLIPRLDGVNAGYGFPVDFVIELSQDNTNWTTAASRTGFARPAATAQTFAFANASARYVRITGTKLQSIPNDSNQYRMQFAEVQVFGTP